VTVNLLIECFEMSVYYCQQLRSLFIYIRVLCLAVTKDLQLDIQTVVDIPYVCGRMQMEEYGV